MTLSKYELYELIRAARSHEIWDLGLGASVFELLCGKRALHAIGLHNSQKI